MSESDMPFSASLENKPGLDFFLVTGFETISLLEQDDIIEISVISIIFLII